MNISKRSFRYFAYSVHSCLLLAAISISYAAPLNISNEPLFLEGKVDPNILVVVDDSGSMNWEVTLSAAAAAIHSSNSNSGSLDFTPNSVEESLELCAAYNVLAYDPNKTYTPWAGTDVNNNSYLPISDLTKALNNPYNGTAATSNLVDITTHFYGVWTDADGDDVYDLGECPSNASDTTAAICRAAPNCIMVNEDLTAAEKENYGNWYSYYRKRQYVAKKATLALIDSSTARIGLGTMHNRNNVGTVIKDMDDEDSSTTADATDKTNLQKKVAQIGASGGTPTSRTLQRAGEYYRTGSGALFGTSTNQGSPIQTTTGGSCQSNFTILMSDGYADSISSYPLSSNVGNTDKDGGAGLNDTIYDGPPYADNLSNTLADVAMYYYERDLSPLPNKVNGQHANMHQHMQTYTVAFGVMGNLSCNPTTDITCTSFTWPTSIAKNQTSIDDMTHAAYNGRGQFLSAQSPQALINQMQGAIDNIQARTSSSAAVAANSTTLNLGTVIYQALFNTGDWHGRLRALPVSIGPTDTRSSCSGVTAGSICNSSDWDTTSVLSGQNYNTGRVILTTKSSTGKGIPFRWPSLYSSPSSTELDSTQVTALLGNAPAGTEQAYGQDLLNYLRGDQSNEGSGRNFRARNSSILGDIVNSAPAFVGAPRFNYPDSLESVTYDSFATANAARSPKMVYVGANDGMLHGFDASTGQEKIAYIPSAAIKNLEKLSEDSYIHRFFVDGTPTVGDVFYSNAWHSVLVGGLRAGGQAIYALDVTKPSAFSEAVASNIVLWEYTDADLGYTFSQPDIVKLNDGTWAAIFGNGYNNTDADGSASTTGEAYLYIVNIQTGALIKKIRTGAGSVTTPNGLATATPVDVNGDYKVDYVYAGDLLGNLWKFNLSSATSSSWSAVKLFTTAAPEAGNPTQPITSRPSVAFHPDASRTGVMIYFGTGRYIDVGDNANTGQNTQTFYGIWDDLDDSNSIPATFSRSGSNYLQQSILLEYDVPSTSNVIRVSSDNSIVWSTHSGWYMDLVNTTASPSGNKGERQVTNSIVRGNRIVFTTLAPNNALCDFGGNSWLMELDFADGGPLDSPPLDINNDGIIDSKDVYTFPDGTTRSPVGLQQDGIITEPSIIGSPSPDKEYKLFNSSDGSTKSVLEKPPAGRSGQRKSWIEL